MTEQNQSATQRAIILAGVPEVNATLYHRIRHAVFDPIVYLQLPTDGGSKAILILRDIEIDRALRHARIDEAACPADYEPDGGLSGDRETATAQAAAECLRRAGVKHVMTDRTLPMIFAEYVRRAGIVLECDLDLGVAERRAKGDEEIAFFLNDTATTESAMEMACGMVCSAEARGDGVLIRDGQPLTSERVRSAISHWLIDRGYSNPPSIVAGGPLGADCHDSGSGELRTGEPVIIDIFPRNLETLYNGDCTRTAVHGEVSDELAAMHAAVRKIKAAATAAVKAGVTGETVHRATIEAVESQGYEFGLPAADAPDDYCALTHGTGHGVGLSVHESPLLDFKGPELVVGDAITIEPGLYRKGLGGIRVEDIIAVTPTGHENLNNLHEGLDWK